MNYILNDSIKDCREKWFHSFEYECVYDIKLTNIGIHQEFISPITLEYMKFESQFYGLSKKIKNGRNNGFIFIEIVKLTITIYSSLSNINIHHYLKHRIHIRHRQFLLSQNRRHVKTHCNDLNNPFRFACSNWYLVNQTH